MRALLGVVFVLLLAVGGAYYLAGRAAPPGLEIVRPERLIGRTGDVEVVVTMPGGAVPERLDVAIEQGTSVEPLFSLDPASGATVTQDGPDRIRVTGRFDRQRFQSIHPGVGRIVASAQRPVLFGLRHVEQTVARDIEIRFDPPRLSILSTHHYVNHGGSELVVYRVEPADVESGVRVGDVTYPGYPAAAAGVAGADPSSKVAFFALLPDQDLETPIQLYARDEAGNEASGAFEHRVFPKPFRRSEIAIDDRFIARVVPPILDNTPEFKATLTAEELADPVASFVRVNDGLRRRNAEEILAYGAETASERLWEGPFQPLGNAQVESSFADQRTYVHDGGEIDRQVHLGFDLAATAAVPIRAANRGKVLHAGWLGIYGNAVIVDHGLGVQSLYAHLSAVDVRVGDMVEKNQALGRSGATGLAAGDHLHFTMLLRGHPVNAIEWWDAHWLEDRVERKLRELQPGNVTNPAGS
jgi:murein DD-endopeptidase MepM/ murein hydrolase activator NlpD